MKKMLSFTAPIVFIACALGAIAYLIHAICFLVSLFQIATLGRHQTKDDGYYEET